MKLCKTLSSCRPLSFIRTEEVQMNLALAGTAHDYLPMLQMHSFCKFLLTTPKLIPITDPSGHIGSHLGNRWHIECHPPPSGVGAERSSGMITSPMQLKITTTTLIMMQYFVM